MSLSVGTNTNTDSHPLSSGPALPKNYTANERKDPVFAMTTRTKRRWFVVSVVSILVCYQAKTGSQFKTSIATTTAVAREITFSENNQHDGLFLDAHSTPQQQQQQQEEAHHHQHHQHAGSLLVDETSKNNGIVEATNETVGAHEKNRTNGSGRIENSFAIDNENGASLKQSIGSNRSSGTIATIDDILKSNETNSSSTRPTTPATPAGAAAVAVAALPTSPVPAAEVEAEAAAPPSITRTKSISTINDSLSYNDTNEEGRVSNLTAMAMFAEARAVLEELQLRTEGNHDTNSHECPPPLKYYKNRIVWPSITGPANFTNRSMMNDTGFEISGTRMIPKILHVSMRSRCLPQDIDMYVKRWEAQLPGHSIIFHDDQAVHDLIHDVDLWSDDFPWLESAMKCVLSTGAMTIDVWRILILYKYGGIYTDIDNWPEDRFNESTIPGDVSGFFYSDDWNRPSQWFMAFEPNHPLMYLTVEEIIRNLLKLEKIQHPKVVFVTGPHAVRQAYVKFAMHANSNITLDDYRNEKRKSRINGVPPIDFSHNITEDIFKSRRTHRGMAGKVVQKEKYPKGILKPKKFYSDKVEHNGTIVKRKERIQLESGVLYWKKGKYGNKHDKELCQSEQSKWRTFRNETSKETHSKRFLSAYPYVSLKQELGHGCRLLLLGLRSFCCDGGQDSIRSIRNDSLPSAPLNREIIWIFGILLVPRKVVVLR
ncbi:unnamed protein product [Pseudo-nitzschia multistriata]|uniref:Alpha 1,4-glycosyltransferase domain-containing protein n=1 Tax=Pseudo-nitzschia multistriata TaxID=183589 RepID=A0A448Z691_9STRA|nr:unnamed protein product [Pseudo-nitzschia multistriata]